MTRLALLVLLVAACQRPAPAQVPPSGARSVVLLPSEALAPDFVAQQRLRGRYGERSFSLDVVVQNRAGVLTLVGLTPFGSRAFVLEQRGLGVSLQKYVDRELPFDPRYVLDDVQRVFFRSAGAGDGTLVREDLGERITERRAGGHPLRRSFERLDGKPGGELVVTFEGSPAPVIAPKVTLDNGWYGYTLHVETLSQTLLP